MQENMSSWPVVLETHVTNPVATITELEAACAFAKRNNLAAVCLLPIFLRKAKMLLAETDVKLAAVVGFPLGHTAVEAKLAETLLAIVDGADDINLHINLTALKNNDWQYLAQELNSLLPVIKSKGIVVKIVLETSLLTDDEMIKCCDLYGIAGVDYIQSSSGYADFASSVEHIRLLRKHLADAVRIKAAGKMETVKFAEELLAAGADRLGMSMEQVVLGMGME
ncbi:MAG: deoC [Ferruginibacter sp.]|nr:deoC [Ferruginibacter sp.]